MKQQSPSSPPPKVDPAWRIGIVHSSYYKEEVTALVGSAREALIEAGIPADHISLHTAYGSFEVPLIGAALARAKEVDALIGIGIIVEGETHHAALLAQAAAQGMMDVQVHLGVPFAFEILHVRSLEQVRARLDKGAEAAKAVLHSLAELNR